MGNHRRYKNQIAIKDYKMNRRQFIKNLGVGIAVLTLPGCKKKSTITLTGKAPNVVFILADDMRLDYLGCMGMNKIVQTPNLDALAKKGTLFSNGFVTTAACTPSRTTIMSGQYERRHGVTFGSRSAMTEKAFSQTYPMLLKEAGYFCGYVGKNHTPIGKSKKGLGYKSGHIEKVFDYWYGNHGYMRFYPKHKIYSNAKADTQIEIIQEGTDNFFEQNPEFAGTKSFLLARPKNKPFCLQINFNVPHCQGIGTMKQLPTDPELYRSTYRDQIDQMPEPNNYVAFEDIKTPKIPRNVYNGKYGEPYNFVKKPDTLREYQVRTCQTVTGIDNLVGKVIDTLKSEGVADNTIVIFTSDHGLQHGEHGLGGKVLLYEDSLRIPLIIYDPRLKKSHGRKVDGLALTVDLAPTILDLVGYNVPARMQGSSLKPLMQGDEVSWRKDFFCENMFMWQNYPRIEAVRSKEWKYIRYFDKKKDQHHILSLIASIQGEKPVYEELYHLTDDPGETKNLADDEKHKNTLEHFRLRCGKLLREAKGDNSLPQTHIEKFKDRKFRSQVKQQYKALKF